MPASWNLPSLLNGTSPSIPYAIVILNTPINANAFNAVINNATLVVCADGGANNLHDYYYGKDNIEELDPEDDRRLPDAIIGDLDSIRPAVMSSFSNKFVRIVKESDQNSTDFAKCLHWLRREYISTRECGGSSIPSSHLPTNEFPSRLDVIVLGDISGRLDQGLSLLHYLYLAKADESLLDGTIYLLSSQSLTFILSPGPNIIHFPQPSETFSENVGIIPLSGPTTITTRGLEWDVTNWATQLGSGMMSTSNHIRAENVEIEVHVRDDESVNLPLFTVELAKRFTACGE
jgi:thiamine pyrophosphokinase